MKIVEYNNRSDITVEFQDIYKAKVKTEYKHFTKGGVKNPYYPSVYDVGIIGNKYPMWVNGKSTKEYEAWKHMLRRCYDERLKSKYITYKNVMCCEEWLLYDNFYEWIHSQENFDKWLSRNRWEVDKDILVKGNKYYSSKTCCLAPHHVNTLFVKHDKCMGNLPIGVTKSKRGNGFYARCKNPVIGNRNSLGYYLTPEQAFQAYKEHKEDLIKQVAKTEYEQGNITKQCYDAMMKYKVEITD